ncbi:Putative organic solute transporter subunit alpha/Transmembrane protein [Colletotrichum destructivum]|uniref:Organic solute transporter subunit alpha/Transmembrane protein n=1 Tax=Colletotrichum destructivum TaxID=34406 RepID=A0AAX4I2D1_9PEZI|nr:Putative organic solute transporter subunit alpha/Transmembrane protein [Colletotrichum destructivum]
MEWTGVIEKMRMQANAVEDSFLTGCLLAQRERSRTVDGRRRRGINTLAPTLWTCMVSPGSSVYLSLISTTQVYVTQSDMETFLRARAESKSSKDGCPDISLVENAAKPLFGNTSFYKFNMILSGSFTAASCLIIFTLMFLHVTHLSKRNEQIKILRISLIIPFWSIISFLSICFPSAEVYLHPWLESVQSICLGTFFLLLCEFVSPSAQHRDVFFAALTVKNKKAADGEQNGLEWFRVRLFSDL